MSVGSAEAVPCPRGARPVTDPQELMTFSANDRGAHLYSLVDLEEPFWSVSRWFRRGDAVVGVVATPSDGVITATGVSTRDPAGSLVLLGEVAAHLPAGLMLTGPIGLGAELARHRDVRAHGRHMKYELVDRAWLPDAAVDDRIRPLGPADLDRLLALYAVEPGAAFFLPSMLGDDSFVGIEDRSGELLAAAGTHVLSTAQRLAALGSIFVRPDHRGRGLGRAVTVGVIRRVVDRCDVIGLNVEAANAPARAIYESLGFAPILDYDETLLT